jgi:hypothetical protein
MKYIIAFLCAIFTTSVLPSEALDAVAAYQKLQQMRAENKLPGLSADGVILPQPLLLEKLKSSVDSELTEIRDLSLTTEGGHLTMLAHKTIDVLVSVDFKVVGVDWRHRAVLLEYRETTRSGSESLLGRVFGSVVLSAFEAATGSNNVRGAISDSPYFRISGNRMTIQLDQIPSLQGTLAWGVGSFRVFDYVGIKSIRTEPNQIRVQLGLV